ncbi:MAG: C2 family cysteine protease [Verrucomicrobiota bacterium]|nr:C2 family cysteine protease [Verrucomicrobiota bacterium]
MGDCYLLSSLSAIAESSIASIGGRHPSVYHGDMFVDNEDGTYGVRFYDNHGAERWVTVDAYVPGYRTDALVNANTVSQETWTMLAEKAYVQLNESDNISQDGTNRYGIGNHFGIAGGSASLALSHISGQEATHKFISEAGDSPVNVEELIAMVDKKLPMVFSTSAPWPLTMVLNVSIHILTRATMLHQEPFSCVTHGETVTPT